MSVQNENRLPIRALPNTEIPPDRIMRSIRLGKATVRRKKEKKDKGQQTKPTTHFGFKPRVQTGVRPVMEGRVR